MSEMNYVSNGPISRRELDEIVRRAHQERAEFVHRSIVGAPRFVWDALRFAFAHLVVMHRRETLAREIYNFDDRLLADIGMVRSEVQSRIATMVPRPSWRKIRCRDCAGKPTSILSLAASAKPSCESEK